MERQSQLLSREVGGKTNVNAAWYYPKTSDAARNIEGYVAFWNGVQITP